MVIFWNRDKTIIPTKLVITKVRRLAEVKILALIISSAPKTIAPADAGIKRLKEKLKALMGDKPKSSPAKIVQPERETPGRMARAWNRPIIKAET